MAVFDADLTAEGDEASAGAACPPLLVSLDSLKTDRPTGIGRYTAGLVAGLLEIGAPDITGFSFNGVEPVTGAGEAALTPGAPPPDPLAARKPAMGVKGAVKAALRPGVRLAFRMAPRILPLQQMAWKRQYKGMLAPLKGRVYHETNFLLRPFDGPRVVTVHDLSVLRFPEFHPAQRVRDYERNFQRSLDQADRIVTDSHVVARELRDMLGIAPERIAAVHLGLPPGFRMLPAEQRTPVLTRHGLSDGGYLLAVGTMEPRKNQRGLIAAYERLPADLQQRFPLVMAGAKGWREHHFADRLQKLEARGALKVLGYVPDADLPALYGGARGFAFPSLYEGFGFPVIEAAACGTPVLTSSGTSMEELAGPGTLLADPNDEDALAEGLRRLLTDDALQTDARAHAAAVAARFTWAATARAMVGVYRGVA